MRKGTSSWLFRIGIWTAGGDEECGWGRQWFHEDGLLMDTRARWLDYSGIGVLRGAGTIKTEAEQCNESYLNPCPAGQKRRFTVTTEPRRCHKCPGCEHRALERGRDLSRPLVMWDVFGRRFSGSYITVEADPVVTCAFVCVAMLEESCSRKQSIH